MTVGRRVCTGAPAPHGHPGSTGACSAARGTAPRRRPRARRRVRGRRRVLRRLGIPHYVDPAGGGRENRVDLAAGVLRAPCAAHPPGGRADADRRRPRRIARAELRPRARRGARQHLGRPVRGELPFRDRGDGLLRQVSATVSVAALLVARRRGAVLPRLAGAARDPRRVRASRPPRAAVRRPRAIGSLARVGDSPDGHVADGRRTSRRSRARGSSGSGRRSRSTSHGSRA